MSVQNALVICWFRSDLRLLDNPALTEAVDTGRTVIPVFILDDISPKNWSRGAASRWWLHHSLNALSADLEKRGFHPLVIMQGNADDSLNKIIKKTGTDSVYWNRRYEPWAKARDKKIKEGLIGQGLSVKSFNAFLMFEPNDIKNKAGGYYKVFTPFSKACLARGGIRPSITKKPKGSFDKVLFKGLSLDDLNLMPDIKWYKSMEKSWDVGEKAAHKRLKEFIEDGAGLYKDQRNLPYVDGVSRLSPHLHFGEISPHQIWHAVQNQIKSENDKVYAGHAHGFLRQLMWREFSYHLLDAFPEFPDQEWNDKFQKFPWQKNKKHLEKWQKGQTGYPIIDAGMRQLWQTGWMHNRVRMIVGSFLVKNLLIDWREGEKWFWDTLVDADLGNNAAGWQWIAGCGADAAPYFRIFNPLLQSKKFDPEGQYIREFVPELKNLSAKDIHAPWEAETLVLLEAGVTLGKDYPKPMVDLKTTRNRALEAYAKSKENI